MKNLTVVSGEVSSIGVSKGGMDRTLFKNVILRDETGKSYKLYNVIAYEVPEEKVAGSGSAGPVIGRVPASVARPSARP